MIPSRFRFIGKVTAIGLLVKMRFQIREEEHHPSAWHISPSPNSGVPDCTRSSDSQTTPGLIPQGVGVHHPGQGT